MGQVSIGAEAAAIGEFSLSHIIIILAILLIFFGPSRLPGLGKSLGDAIRGFKKGLDDDEPAPRRREPREQITADAHHDEATASKEKTSSHSD